jgi:toxin ParE1/3/4
MAGRLLLRRAARKELDTLFEYLDTQNGTQSALDFIDDFHRTCDRLLQFPFIGRSREDLAQDLRTIHVRRRLMIAYRVQGKDIEVVALAYAGRDWESLFSGPD